MSDPHAGIPDIDNIMALALMFDISIDKLLRIEHVIEKIQADYLFESVT